MIQKAPPFCVLTVSKRTGWEEVAYDSLERQSVKAFDWIVVSEQPFQYRIGSPLNVRTIQPPEQLRLSNLNASLNEGLRYCHGQFVIFYQDFIELPTNCFEKLLALGDDETFVTTCTPNADGTDDNRYTGLNVPRTCLPPHWEANVALAPLRALYELGGFDEEYDNGWSWDNVNVAERAAMMGYKFVLDESNRPRLLDHPKEKTIPINASRHSRIMGQIRNGERPLKCPYL